MRRGLLSYGTLIQAVKNIARFSRDIITILLPTICQIQPGCVLISFAACFCFSNLNLMENVGVTNLFAYVTMASNDQAEYQTFKNDHI